jgi:predicted metalloendopeptidase
LIVCLAVVAGTAGAAEMQLLSGIDLQFIDKSVRPQDDFYHYVNGKWLERTEIPADKARYGTFDKLRDDALE